MAMMDLSSPHLESVIETSAGVVQNHSGMGRGSEALVEQLQEARSDPWTLAGW